MGSHPTREEGVTLITLHVPKAGQGHYAIVDHWLIGPIAPEGEEIYESISVRSLSDSIREKRGKYRENFVVHNAREGEIYYNPNFGRCIPAPTGETPERVHVDYLRNDGTTWGEYALNGVAFTGASAAQIYSHAIWHTAVDWVPPCKLIVYTVVVDTTKPTQCNSASIYEYTYVYDSNNLARFTRRYRSMQATYGLTLPGNWLVRRNYSDITSWCNGHAQTPETWVPTAHLYAIAQNDYSSLSVSTQHMLSVVDVVVRERLSEEPFPLDGEHPGDIAMRAVKNLSVNKVNMLEFLADLRHPTQLIPKLKNLSKLKTSAGNYLSYEYGILPTMDDLKTIFHALAARKPHLDLFGYRTVSASSVVYELIGDLYYQVEQHIKVAVHDEDSGLCQLANSLENIGIFPTFENLWDLVPYSFVIDWFVDVGGLLERVDTRLRLMRYKIPYVTQSRKESSTANLSPTQEAPYVGTVTKKRYSRWVTQSCPVPPLSLSSEPQVTDHWLEAGALVISRGKI